MYAHNQQFTRPLRALGIFVTIALAAASPKTLLAAPDPCTTLIPLTAGETWRDPGRDLAESVCFDLDFEAPGIVALDLISSTEPRARLVFDGRGRLRQTPTTLVAATSGSFRIRVEGEDPERPLPPFRLATRFSAAVSKSETDGETELDPDPFTHCGAKSETDGETELDPDPFTHCGAKSETDGETELDPDPFAGGGAKGTSEDPYDLSRIPATVRPHLATLCQEASDDHGDSFLCATALAEDRAIGEIAGDWDDDLDAFRLRVKDLGSVELDGRADFELAVELYDRYGLPIGATVSSRGHLRSVRTLVPGVYFVRIRGLDGSSGSYSIHLAP